MGNNTSAETATPLSLALSMLNLITIKLSQLFSCRLVQKSSDRRTTWSCLFLLQLLLTGSSGGLTTEHLSSVSQHWEKKTTHLCNLSASLVSNHVFCQCLSGACQIPCHWLWGPIRCYPQPHKWNCLAVVETEHRIRYNTGLESRNSTLQTANNTTSGVSPQEEEM